MKKILCFAIVIALFSLCFTACRSSYEENVFFSEEMLTENKLENMPVPPHLDDSVMENGNVLYLRLDKNEYEKYVSELLSYLRDRKDIYYLGYSVDFHYNNLFRADVIAPIKDDYDVSLKKHDFFFSLEDRLTGRTEDLLASPVNVGIIYEYGQLEYKGFEYNTRIFIYNGIRANADYDTCAAEHTYDDGIEYQIPGRDDTVFEYTCLYCGSTDLSDFIGDMKIYTVTIEDTDADHYIIDRPTEIVSGVLYKMNVHKLDDAYVKIIINGTEIEPYAVSFDGRYLMYGFIMPCSDIVISTELVNLAE